MIRFLANGMLGKVTRWLRMLGYDVEYAGDMEDKGLVRKAKVENRILLTRDAQLLKQALGQGVEAFHVRGQSEVERLAVLSKRFRLNLQLNPASSRCPKCNCELKRVEKSVIANRIRPSTKALYEEFWTCRGCEKVYWQGSHWKRIEETLKRVRILEKD